jgi:hypothetical protein
VVAGIEVDPGAVVATGSSMKPLAAEISGPAQRLKGLTDPAESPLPAAFGGMKAAWGRALELMGESAGLLADKIQKAGVAYQVTEGQISGAFEQASKQPVDFTLPSSRGGTRFE